MKLNWAERWVVNNPLRVMEQRFQVRWMKNKIRLPQKARALEIGCGRGAGAMLILEEFQPSLLHAMDLDLRMIRRAKAYLSANDIRSISLSVGDSVSLPIGTGSFDAVFGFGFLHHVPNWRRALGEVSRVLKPEGLYLMEELYPPFYQNLITKHLLVHPREDRFFSHDLRRAPGEAGFFIKDVLESKKLGLLAVLVKQ